MLNKENPATRMRCNFCLKSLEMGLSAPTRVELVECMDGKTEEEKEKLAEQLLAIISEDISEEEMIQKSLKLR